MTKNAFLSSLPYVRTKKKNHVLIHLIKEQDFKNWLKKQNKNFQTQANQRAFKPSGKRIFVFCCDNAQNNSCFSIYAWVKDNIEYYDLAGISAQISQEFSKEFLSSTSFELSTQKWKKNEIEKAHIGWGWGLYKFNQYKNCTSAKPDPVLLIPKDAPIDINRVHSFVEAVNYIRNLVNTPANMLGPQELLSFSKTLASQHSSTISVTQGKELEKDFPLIHLVGSSSSRKPCLIDIQWGKKSHPKLTLVGKGVCFDTGGLDLKPSAYMKHMKKDMGGAAHALALAHLIMALKLKVRLRVLIPAVENAVSSTSFRPGDIIKARNGLFVENTNTDAEGRLILADTLTYASEEKTDMIIDFATLTGSARAGLGPDIPPFFSLQEKTAKQLQKLSLEAEDPVWNMPLWQPYKKHIENSNADLVNSAGLPGDLIYSALFLQRFLTKNVKEWLHLDIFSWEQTGKPGRPRNAADTGMRAVFALIEKRYGT